MNVRDTILCLCKADPSCNKWSAYKQFFSTVGNGYQWYNGEIVSDVYFSASVPEDVRDALISTDHFYGKVSKSLEKRATDFSERKSESIVIDPSCKVQHELIYNVPPNITADWQAAVNEWNAELKRSSRVFNSEAEANADIFEYMNRSRVRKSSKASIDKTLALIKFRFARYTAERLDTSRLSKK